MSEVVIRDGSRTGAATSGATCRQLVRVGCGAVRTVGALGPVSVPIGLAIEDGTRFAREDGMVCQR